MEILEQRASILVFGGTGFMGLELISQILTQYQNATVYHLNRGKDHWNNKIQQLHSTYGDRLRHIKCNRRNRDKFITAIQKATENICIENSLDISQDMIWNMVVDFSCYIPSDMHSTESKTIFASRLMLALKSIKIGVYLHISTDSVYEVTQAKYVEKEIDTDDSYATNDSFSSFHSYSSSSSSDSIEYTIERRDDKELRQNKEYYTDDGLIKEPYGFYNKRSHRFRDYLCTMDAYGFEKLECENVLVKHCKDKINYIIIRLPDVIGPYDDSARFWVIVMKMMVIKELYKADMIELADVFKFEFCHEEQAKPMSLISSNNVAKIAEKILEQTLMKDFGSESDKFTKTICNQAYNFCLNGQVTLSELHKIIFYEIMKDTSIEFDKIWSENEKSLNTYPSVHCGAISNQKAVLNFASINFEFSEIFFSISESAKFFETLTLVKIDEESSKISITSEYPKNLIDAIDKLSKVQRSKLSPPSETSIKSID